MTTAVSNLREFTHALEEFASVSTPAQIRTVQRVIALKALRGIVKKTPVDTGRARANWQVTLGVPAAGQVEGNPNPVAVGSKVISGLHAFDVVYITNNLPYIEVLENGGYVPPDPENSEDANKRRAQRRTAAQQRNSRSRDAKARGLKSSRGADGGVPFVAHGYSKLAPHGMVGVTVSELLSEFAT